MRLDTERDIAVDDEGVSEMALSPEKTWMNQKMDHESDLWRDASTKHMYTYGVRLIHGDVSPRKKKLESNESDSPVEG